MPTSYLKPVFEAAISKLSENADYNLFFENPKNPEHGDFSTNVAMTLSKALKKAPRQIAEDIINALEYDKLLVEKVEIAGPGFINIKMSNAYYQSYLKDILWTGSSFGKSSLGAGLKANVEYVSVNPTGLLHLGHGRNAVIGDTLANLLEWIGYDVTREYYFNNAGGQMQRLAESVYARYKQKCGFADFPFPENGYHGDYVNEIAQKLISEKGDTLLKGSGEDLEICKKFGEAWCFDKIKKTLERMSVNQDLFYNEDSLYKEGKIADLLNKLDEKGLLYEKEGARWMKFSELGLSDDRVIVRSNGEPTYRLPDIAYHREKFLRGFDLMIDVFGADHIATIPDVLAGVKALGFDSSKVKAVIHQFVTLTENGEQVKMSKRSGKSYTLDELLDEVGADVVRFFLLMRGVSTHLEFDLGLAREQSDTNPVFYLQYAHARMISIFNNAKERGDDFDIENAEIELLNHPAEIKLIKKFTKFESTIQKAALNCEPQILAEYLRDLASDFHSFYHDCRVLGVETALQHARLALVFCSHIIMSNGLKILGVTAPDRM